eukprot:3992335-Amphidinium_carterae.2
MQWNFGLLRLLDRLLPSWAQTKGVLRCSRSPLNVIRRSHQCIFWCIGAEVFEWIFVNSPQRATGPADPRIEQTDAYEWYGEVGGAFETAWQAQHSAGYEESLTVLRRVGLPAKQFAPPQTLTWGVSVSSYCCQVHKV